MTSQGVEGRTPPRPGGTWRILFAHVGEAFIFCPECAEREFDQGDSEDA